MSAIRNVLLWVFFGALAGVWAGALAAEKFVPWFNTPGSGIVAQCECHQISVDTINRTLTWEVIGMVVGGVVFLVLALVLGAGRSKKPQPPAAAATPAA
jgi:hypothetical protein